MRKLFLFLAALFAATPHLFADAERAVMQRPAIIYLAPDKTSTRLGEVDRGREVVVIEHSREYTKVLASLGGEKELTGWIIDKGVIRATTPDGDRILFGEAVDSEAEADRANGRKDAAQEAERLYYRMAEYFPKSPLAGESLWRATDIRWQIEKQDIGSRPSAHEKDSYIRQQIDEDWAKETEKRFPGTRWADMASFLKIDNHLCGDWQGDTKCPEKESDMYATYADHHPNSPRRDEALYEAARRQASLVEMYLGHDDKGKSDAAMKRAIELAQRIPGCTSSPGPAESKKPINDAHSQTWNLDHNCSTISSTDAATHAAWNARAVRLIYMLNNHIPVYGSGID